MRGFECYSLSIFVRLLEWLGGSVTQDLLCLVGSSDRDVLRHLQELERFRKCESCHAVFPQLQMQYSKVIKVKLWVELSALLIHLIVSG